jgi:MYXO-CTERM domain-containing protein
MVQTPNMRRFAPLALLIAASSIAAASSAQVAPRLSFTELDQVDLGDLRVVSYQQTIEGIPVLHRGARVATDATGHASRAERVETLRPASLVPTLTAKNAIARAASLGVPANDLGARLMILPTGGTPLLVWAVVGDLGPIPSRPVVFLDAHTGDVALQYDAALSLKKAKVHSENPIKTPTLTEVTLTNDETKTGLQNSLVKAVNCIDKKTTKTVNVGVSLTVHTCELEPTIVPDTTGDYLSLAPVPGGREDQYSELSMFFHTEKVYAFAKSIGFPDAKVVPITAIANLRMPAGLSTFNTAKMADPNIPLENYDNAFFAEKDPLLSTTFGLDGDAMWFGQGTLADFGYDGDVVYHEFGHFLVSRTIKLGGGTVSDEYGLSYSPGGLNEGIADIISFFLTNDPELGEYTATGIAIKGKGIRSMTNTFKFPDAITGEVHQDSEPFSAAVFEVYSALDATKKSEFQKAFMKVLLTAPQGNIGFADFAELVIKGVPQGDALRAAFEKRGIKKGDPRVRVYADPAVKSVEPLLGIHAPGKNDFAGGKSGEFAPGLFQISYDAPAGGVTKLHVTFKQVQAATQFGSASGGLFGSSGTAYTPALLVKAGGEPIKFTYGPLTHDAALSDCTVGGDKVTVTCDTEVQVDGKWGETAKIHLMLVNKGEKGGDFDAIALSSEGPPEPPPPDPGATPTPTTTETTKSGCACDVAGSSSSNAPTFALLGFALIIAARRRRS